MVPAPAMAASLWSGTTVKNSSLFVDTPAPQLGINDIVVILIDENTQATTDADTEAELEDSIDSQISRWFSVENGQDLWKYLFFQSPDVTTHPNARSNLNNLPHLAGDVSNEFEGEGETTRNSKATATIAARVIAVEPNGNLVIEGKRHVRINQETTILTVTGIANPKDISSENYIRSSQIAELFFSVDGQGILADLNKRGILSKILAWIR